MFRHTAAIAMLSATLAGCGGTQAIVSAPTLREQAMSVAERDALREEFNLLMTRVSSLMTPQLKIAQLEEAAPRFEGTRYEQMIEHRVRVQRDILATAEFSRRYPPGRPRTARERIEMLEEFLEMVRGSSYEQRVPKVIEREKRAARRRGEDIGQEQ